MIIANLATYPPRREHLDKVVATISSQVDRLNIVLNQYNSVPVELAGYPNVVPIIPKEDLKDAGKFYPVVDEARYVFLIDDDIVYPQDYISTTIARFEALALFDCVGGYHGSLYQKPRLRNYLRRPGLLFNYKFKVAAIRSGGFYFENALNVATVVDQIGTGTAILRGKDMPPFEYMRTSQMYVDVRLARWIFERGIMPVCLPRAANWLGAIDYDESIHRGFTTKNPQNVNAEILTYAFKVKHRGEPVSNFSRIG
jgi:hypothetical protein